ncbi:MAG: sensor histidine kinase [Anaerolineaceae bacterium]|nr:sensor histidine kinase [Anaerolineaceae bacterium]
MDIRYEQFLHSLKIQSLVIAPLVRNSIVFGFLICGSTDHERSYSKDDLELLKGLANQVSIAISNANLFEQLRSGRERQQFLSRQLVKIQESERRSLSLELHDEIGQMLTGLQFSVKSAMSNSSEEQKNKLDQVQILVSEIISQVRELSINLRPSLLDDLGILPTLTWHFDRFEAKTGIHVTFEYQNLDRRFPPELEITVFRIVQEALTNVARYSKAAQADVRIAVSGSVMQVSISDQGCGFDASVLSKNQSMGIEGMRERAYSIGGLLEIHSEPGKGTRIQARLPVSGQLERRHDDRNNSSG